MQKTTTQGYSKQNSAAKLPTSMKFLDKHAIAKQSNRKARENEYEFGTQQTIANQNNHTTNHKMALKIASLATQRNAVIHNSNSYLVWSRRRWSGL